MTRNILIFVDGLPYYYLDGAPFLKTLPYKKSITPGVGFSVNIKPELYSGLTADQLGYFGEFGVNSDRPTRWQKALSPLQFTKQWPKLDRLAHKFFIRLGFDVLNIPFGYVQYFAKTHDKSIYAANFPFPTLFSETQTEYIAAETMARDGTSRDRRVYQLALERLNHSGNLHLSFIGLDEAGHAYGVGTSAYDQTLTQIDKWIEDLVRVSQRFHPDTNVVIFSDHGMANITSPIAVQLEKHLGPSRPNTYLYFLDSVMLRLWIYNSAVFTRALRLLEEWGHGTILSQSCREKYGVTASFCGDIIFILDEGRIFSPNYFGLKKPKAMHGYLPHLESQQATLLSHGPGIKQDHFNRVETTRDMFHYLLDLCRI